MISALRKIRNKMLNQNRVQRYLTYAIGEIVLVVIGILIALQINTWNKAQQNHVIGISLLESLKVDLQIQKELIEEQLVYEDSILWQVDSTRQFTNPDFDLASIPRRINDLSSRHTFKANKATYNNMIANGGIALIGNAELETNIIRYYQRLDYVESVCNNNNLYMVDSNFGNFAANNALGFEVDASSQLVTDIQFTNEQRYLLLSQLLYRENAAKSIKRISKSLLVITEELIGQIDVVLKH